MSSKQDDELSRALMAWQHQKTPANERALWRVLFPYLEQRLKRVFFASRLAWSGHELEDCLEEIVEHMLQKDVLDSWDPTRAPAGCYLWVVAQRRLSDISKRADLLRRADRDGLEDIEDADTAETLLRRATCRRQLRALLFTLLPAGEWAVYEGIYEKGWSSPAFRGWERLWRFAAVAESPCRACRGACSGGRRLRWPQRRRSPKPASRNAMSA